MTKPKVMAGGAFLYEGPPPSEELEQEWLFYWATVAKIQYPELRSMYHIPNGGLRSKAEAARFKRAGVKAGTPDIHLPAARTGADGKEYHSLYIELKRLKDGRVTQEQRDRIKLLRAQGNACEVCKGWQAARDVIVDYLCGNYAPIWIDPKEG